MPCLMALSDNFSSKDVEAFNDRFARLLSRRANEINDYLSSIVLYDTMSRPSQTRM